MELFVCGIPSHLKRVLVCPKLSLDNGTVRLLNVGPWLIKGSEPPLKTVQDMKTQLPRERRLFKYWTNKLM